jgi:hypothetical protein
MGCMPALSADVPAVYMGNHGPELKVLNTVGTSNDLAHMNPQSLIFTITLPPICILGKRKKPL